MKNILCFGDSNTWGYNPETKERYPEGIRWTSLVQSQLDNKQVHIIEEGLCGRTTVFEDERRPRLKGKDTLPEIFEKYESIDSVVLMLGTNDCKTFHHSTSKEIAKGVDQCLEILLEHVPAENILLVSPIHLGELVWKEEYDPDFNQNSVNVSKELKQEYLKVSRKRGVRFLSASDVVAPSEEDQEHLNVEGHRVLADAIYEAIIPMISKCA